MAAPPEITIRSLSGKYTLNKSLSDSQDAFLSLQGIGWVTRKGISIATITLTLNEYEQDGATHVDITTTASSLSSTRENRVFDWAERVHKDQLFGSVKGKSRLIKKADFQSVFDNITDDEKKYLLAETLRNGSPSAFLDDELVQSSAFSQDTDWIVEQLWGFETVGGVRRYTRRLICKKRGKTELMRLVYDYNGPVDG